MEDISWPSSPIGVISCTASVLCHRTGRREEVEDISWPSSPIGVVSCTASVLSHRTGQPPEASDISWPYWSPIGWSARAKKVAEGEAEKRRGEEEGKGRRDRGKSYNLHTDGGKKR